MGAVKLDTASLLLLPLAVAAFDLSLLTAVVLVIGVLAWRWLQVMRSLRSQTAPAMVLETIGASHYVEKVRWCLDRLGLDYQERVCAGTLGAFYRGRTVPLLEFRTGMVRSSIGNSAEILRYLWGTYGSDGSDRAKFLEPLPARVELERRLDRYGRQLQVWLYTHVLSDRELTLTVWGAYDPRVPLLERLLIRLLYPVQVILIQRAFRLSTDHYEVAKQNIRELLAEVDAALQATPASILGDPTPNYTDLCFAALSSLWVLPDNLGGRDHAILSFNALPEPMQADILAFRQAYPAAYEFIVGLYRDQRTSAGDQA